MAKIRSKFRKNKVDTLREKHWAGQKKRAKARSTRGGKRR